MKKFLLSLFLFSLSSGFVASAAPSYPRAPTGPVYPEGLRALATMCSRAYAHPIISVDLFSRELARFAKRNHLKTQSAVVLIAARSQEASAEIANIHAVLLGKKFAVNLVGSSQATFSSGGFAYLAVELRGRAQIEKFLALDFLEDVSSEIEFSYRPIEEEKWVRPEGDEGFLWILYGARPVGILRKMDNWSRHILENPHLEGVRPLSARGGREVMIDLAYVLSPKKVVAYEEVESIDPNVVILDTSILSVPSAQLILHDEDFKAGHLDIQFNFDLPTDRKRWPGALKQLVGELQEVGFELAVDEDGNPVQRGTHLYFRNQTQEPESVEAQDLILSALSKLVLSSIIHPRGVNIYYDVRSSGE